MKGEASRLNGSTATRPAEAGTSDAKAVEAAAVRLLAAARAFRRGAAPQARSARAIRRTPSSRSFEKLAGKRLVSDERFAANFVHHHAQARPGSGPHPGRAAAAGRRRRAKSKQALRSAEVDWVQLARRSPPAQVRRGRCPAAWVSVQSRRASFNIAASMPSSSGPPFATNRARGTTRRTSPQTSDSRLNDDRQASVQRRTARAVPRVFPRARAPDRAVELARARQRPDAAVHERRHGAVQGRVPGQGQAQLQPRGQLAALRARRRQAQRPRERRLHRAAPHVLRDARQLQLRRLLQEAMRSASPGTSSPARTGSASTRSA